MTELSKMTVTGIFEVVTVPSPMGETYKTDCRPHYGISFCREGRITYTQNSKKYVSDPAHVIILPKGQKYSLHRDKKGEFAVINFECCDYFADEFVTIPIDNPEPLLRRFEQMKSLFPFKKNKALIMSLFYEILHLVSSANEAETNILFPAVKYIENHLSVPEISNSALASLCNVSEVYFRKLFVKTYGIPPRQYLISVRIENAKHLLTDGVLQIKEIAELCGFSNTYHFCRIFKSKTGMTPTEFMKKNRIFKI